MFFEKVLKKLTKAASTEPNYHKDVKSEELDQTLSTCSNREPERPLFAGRYWLNEETVFEIGKFTILWNMFECLYCDTHCTIPRIKQIAKKIDINPDLRKQLAEVLTSPDVYEEDIRVIKLLYPEKAQEKVSEYDETSITSFYKQQGDDPVLTEGCLLTIRRIRNNMMHGLKSIAYLDVQIELFRTANAILDDILKKYA